MSREGLEDSNRGYTPEEFLKMISEKYPNAHIKMTIGDTPEAQKIILEKMLQWPKIPNQTVIYESEMRGPYNEEQWDAEKDLIRETYSMGCFNKMSYCTHCGGISGVAIRNRNELEKHLSRIDKLRNESWGKGKMMPQGSVMYALGMNLADKGKSL